MRVSTRKQHVLIMDNLYRADGSLYKNTAQDEQTFTRASIWASVAIIEDKLFFYGLYAPQKIGNTTTLNDG